jgi:hypothetical protein
VSLGELGDVEAGRDRLIGVDVPRVGDDQGAIRREEEDTGVSLSVGVVVLRTVDHQALTAAARLEDVIFGRQLRAVAADLALDGVVADELAGHAREVDVADLVGRRFITTDLLLEVCDLLGVLDDHGLVLLLALLEIAAGAGAARECEEREDDADDRERTPVALDGVHWFSLQSVAGSAMLILLGRSASRKSSVRYDRASVL